MERTCQLRRIEYDYADTGSGYSDWWLCDPCSNLSHPQLESMRMSLFMKEHPIFCTVFMIATVVLFGTMLIVGLVNYLMR